MALAAAAAVSGCVQVASGPGANGVGVVSGDGVRWAWFDPNLLRRPALFVERIEHQPPPADRVRHFRWLHGAGADDPLLRHPMTPGHSVLATEFIVEPPIEPLTEPPIGPEVPAPAELVPDDPPPDPVPHPALVPPPELWRIDAPDVADVPDAPPSEAVFDGPAPSTDSSDLILPAGA